MNKGQLQYMNGQLQAEVEKLKKTLSSREAEIEKLKAKQCCKANCPHTAFWGELETSMDIYITPVNSINIRKGK